MVDTSNNTERDWNILKGMVDALGIDCRKLDIFITHEHPDHTGLVPKLQTLGARAFMNPDETRKRVDLLHSYLADEHARIENLRIVGVTKEETPEVFDTFMEYTTKAYQSMEIPLELSFIPIHPGEILSYGGYCFEVVLLKGHTFGQCGLYEPQKKLMFVGDQLMTTIVPIVGTQETDLGMLKCYMNSLGELKHKYKDCYFLPCHYGEIKDVEKEVNPHHFRLHGKVRDHEACAGGGGNGPDHPRHRCADLRKKSGTARLRAFRFLHPDLGQDLFLHGVHDGRRLYRALRTGRHHLLESLVIRLTQFVPDVLKITGKFRSITAF